MKWKEIRKQHSLQLCILLASRTQVTQKAVFPKGSPILLPDLLYGQWFIVLLKFSCSLHLFFPAQTCRLKHPLLVFTLLISNAAHQPHRSSDSCPGTMFSLQLSHAWLLPLTSDCAAFWRRACLLHCARPFYISTDSWDALSNSFWRKWKVSLTNTFNIGLVLYPCWRSYLVYLFLKHLYSESCFLLPYAVFSELHTNGFCETFTA